MMARKRRRSRPARSIQPQRALVERLVGELRRVPTDVRERARGVFRIIVGSNEPQPSVAELVERYGGWSRVEKGVVEVEITHQRARRGPSACTTAKRRFRNPSAAG